MNKSIYYLIQREYEKRRYNAENSFRERLLSLYEKDPELEKIEDSIKQTGLRYSKMLLSGQCSQAEASDKLSQELKILSDRKSALLARQGLSVKSLKPQYTCSECNDSGHTQSESSSSRCSCFKQQFIGLIHAHANLKLTETENFSAFDATFYATKCELGRYGIEKSPRENILSVKDRCTKFIENFMSSDEKSLFFCGRTGVGKTFMCNCIAFELIEKGFTVLYQTAPMLFDAIHDYKIRSFSDDNSEESIYKNFMEVDLLIIDDLGTETKSPGKYAELQNILNTRQINNLNHPCKTIISSNIGTKELFEYYDERIASRIMGNFTILLFAGEDIRRLKLRR